MKSELLEELWQIRRQIEKEHDGDIKRVFEDMRKKTAESKRKHYAGTMRRKPTKAR